MKIIPTFECSLQTSEDFNANSSLRFTETIAEIVLPITEEQDKNLGTELYVCHTVK